MKRVLALIVTISVFAAAAGASEHFFQNLSEVQRYDLADAYSQVADRYAELGDAAKSEDFRRMVEVIFPGFRQTQRPAAPEAEAQTRRPDESMPDEGGADASRYYFKKLLQAVFSENTPLTLSVIAGTLYLPLYDEGVNRSDIQDEIAWFFETYDVSSIAPGDVFQMDTITTTALNNGYWRLEVETQAPYANALPEATFWSEKMGFYFRKYPEGWRLAAIGPVS